MAASFHVISYKKIRDFLANHPEHSRSGRSLHAWYKHVSKATWENFSQVRASYSHADRVGKFVVFNVGGNKFRIVTEINFDSSTMFVRHVLTHEEYDRGGWKNPA